jgi:hypothetical protein
MYPNVTINSNPNEYTNYHECITIRTTDNTVIHLFDIHLLDYRQAAKMQCIKLTFLGAF